MLYRTAPGPVLAHLDRPTAPQSTSIAVIADPHVTPRATGTWKVYHRTEQRLLTALRTANRLGVDAVVSTGDLTKDGAPGEFERVDALLERLAVPFVAVPGNHDVPKTFDDHRTPTVSAFAHAYAGGRLPFVERVGGIDVVGVNSASAADESLADHHVGAVSTEQLDWLSSILPGLSNPIVVCHHNLTHASTHTGQFPDADFYQVENAREFASVLAEGGVELVVSGHIHWPATATVAGVREVIAPATCSLPQGFLHLTVDSTGTTVELVPLADRAGFEEAYAHARDGEAHGQGLADCVDRGLLNQLPLVDERPEATTAAGSDRVPSGQ